jgi:hypothetical protein
MSGFSKLIAVIALFAAACSVPAFARGAGTHVNDAKYYGPVYGWRYSPPPTAASEPACAWTEVRAVRNGQAVTRHVRRCS